MEVDLRGFNAMIGILHKKTALSYKEVVKGVTGSVLENAARKTKKSQLKKIKKDVELRKSITFKSSAGHKIRRAKDGHSLIFKAAGSPSGMWLKVRNEYNLKNIGSKIPSVKYIPPKLQNKINAALSEYRKKLKATIEVKKARIASGQASFLYIMEKLRIRMKNKRGLSHAIKSKLTQKHKSALSGHFLSSGDKVEVIIKSKSASALNPRSGGIFAFGAAINGQVKAFKTAARKDLKKYVQKFAEKNGFATK